MLRYRMVLKKDDTEIKVKGAGLMSLLVPGRWAHHTPAETVVG